MENHYIVVATDTLDLLGRSFSAFEVSTRRLEHKHWPLYEHTACRSKISCGDKVLIYVAGSGKNAQTFLASASVNGIEPVQGNMWDRENLITEQAPFCVLALSVDDLFPNPISIRPILKTLSFIPKNKSKWGAVMQTGLKKISLVDYETIVSGQPQCDLDTLL